MLWLPRVFALFAFVGCGSETREVNYSSYESAVEAGAFRAGWLPSWLPPSSAPIVEVHDLDTNIRMWASEVPIGTEVNLPLSCVSAKAQSLPKPPFERHWWPDGVPYSRAPGQEFMFFKCGSEYVGLAAAGGKLVGWTAQ